MNNKNKNTFIFSSTIQTILSVLELHQISHQSGSRTLPPVGNYTLPRRTYLIYLHRYTSTILYRMQVIYFTTLHFLKQFDFFTHRSRTESNSNRIGFFTWNCYILQFNSNWIPCFSHSIHHIIYTIRC